MIWEHKAFLSTFLLLSLVSFIVVLILNGTASFTVDSASAQTLTTSVDTEPMDTTSPELLETLPVTDAVDTVPPEVEEPSPVTEAVDTVPLEVEDSSPVTDAVDTVPLEVEDSSPVTDAVDTVPPEVENSSPVTDAVDTVPPEVENSSPVTDAVDTVPLELEDSSPATEAVDTVPLEVEEPSPVTEAVDTVPLEVEDSSPATEAVDTVPLEVEDSSPVTEAVDTVPLEVEEPSPVTEAVDTMLPEVAHAMQPASPVNTAPSVNHNDILYMIWEQEPRFGGMWVSSNEDGKVLHVLLTGGEEGALTAANKVHRAAAEIFGRSFDTVVWEQADYTIGELTVWHASLRERVWDIPGVKTLDLDERENNLGVGVEDLAITEDEVYSLADDLDIPAEAVVVYESETVGILPPAPAHIPPDLPRDDYAYATSSHSRTLYDPLPPAVGGTRIILPTNGFCTLGFGVRLVDEIGVVTNSHCTAILNALDGSELLYTVDRELLAVETIDPTQALDTEGIRRCMEKIIDFTGCRYSDAAYAVGRDIPISVGLIARPKALYTEQRIPNSEDAARRITEIDEDNPYFKIVGLSSVLVGETVNKVGTRTGWTEGTVTGTCIDENTLFGADIRLCNTFTDYFSGGGDSGSPVFIRKGEDSDYVELVGLNWGGSFDGGEGIFSPISAVFDELFPDIPKEERVAKVVHLCGRTEEVLHEILLSTGSLPCEEVRGREAFTSYQHRSAQQEYRKSSSIGLFSASESGTDRPERQQTGLERL